ncbi:5-hydroxytryptamine receptor 3C [Liparis tanakae]|uniref:5-hydroxytryptamine receptor 3C n=1 Tax=Liparis tanakae TaxID=230148 RepID=A0A4Z2IEQ5_9TELE|nr:5-hydroxytryptamine receptor 3C [Liparis tanakae]
MAGGDLYVQSDTQVVSDGRVYDKKPIRVVSSCQSEVYNFPFDIRNCSLTFGSYLHVVEEIRMMQSHTDAEVMEESRQVMLTKGEWELVDIEAAQSTLEKPDGSYSSIKYHVILRRRSILYVVNLLIPSCFLVTVDLFSFILPPDSACRTSFKMTLILGYTVFLMITNNLLPALRKIPLISMFFSLSFTLMVTSLLETMFIVNFQNRTSNKVTVPHWLKGHSGPTYESMQAVFDREPFRPAVNLSNPTITNISFTLYAVLGVVVIKRRPVLYVVNLLIPSSFLMLIDILSFYLPPHSVDRASFKMTLILGYTVFLLIMNDLLPSTANGTPIIGQRW